MTAQNPLDPFSDYAINGYLQNSQKASIDDVKVMEHDIFTANLPDAIKYLQSQKQISYKSYLKTHEILFSALYDKYKQLMVNGADADHAAGITYDVYQYSSSKP